MKGKKKKGRILNEKVKNITTLNSMKEKGVAPPSFLFSFFIIIGAQMMFLLYYPPIQKLPTHGMNR